MKKTIILYLLITTFLFSCTIEKRRYNRGFHVEWFSGSSKKKNNTENQQEKKQVAKLNEAKNQEVQIAPKPVNSASHVNVLKTDVIEKSSENKAQKSEINKSEKQLSQFDYKTVKADAKRLSNSKKLKTIQAKNTKVKKDGNKIIGYGAALMAIFSVLLIKTQRKRVNRLSRWAKNNPKKAQGAIVGIQLPLIAWATMLGYNFHEMGYSISNWVSSMAGAVMLLGFLKTPFLRKKGSFKLPKTQFFNQVGYLAITVSSLAMFSHFGNTVSEKYNGSRIHNKISSADHAIFGESHLDDSEAYNISKNSQKSELRKKLAGGSCALAIFLIALLSILICAGACAAVFGVALIIDGEILGLLLILAGVAVIALCIRGIKNLIQWCMPESIEPKEVEKG